MQARAELKKRWQVAHGAACPFSCVARLIQ